MSDKTYNGSCLCNKVKFKITGAITNIIYCHCSKCRKAQGSAFATNGNVDTDKFKFITGENALTSYKPSKDQTKYFCKFCGSPILSKNSHNPDKVRVRIGTIESDITEHPEAHIFVNSKANWEKIESDLPQFEAYQPEL